MSVVKKESSRRLQLRLERLERLLAATRRQLQVIDQAPSLETLLEWHAAYYQVTVTELTATATTADHRAALQHLSRVACWMYGYAPAVLARAIGVAPSTVRSWLNNYENRCLDSETYRRGAQAVNQYYTQRARQATGLSSSSLTPVLCLP